MMFDDWCVKQAEASPQFHYWHMVMHLEGLILVYVRSLRDANFSLYMDALTALAPWFFALNHTHYSQWVPVHIRDMITLHQRLPQVAKEFDEGNFVVCKTTTPLLGHCYRSSSRAEQYNRQRRWGAIGLTQNPRALLRWMVAGPEIARVIDGF